MSMGTKMAPLFSTSKKLAKIAGEELAAELCTGCTGVLESMKPLLMLEDVIAGKVSREEYIKVCGHRSVDEMELARPYPYEAENFPERIIAEHKKSGVNAHLMQRECEERYNKTVKRFKSEHPNKAARFDKIIAKYIKANHVRENIRSKSVWIFCIIREFMLKTGDTVRVNGSAGIVEKQAVGISQTHL